MCGWLGPTCRILERIGCRKSLRTRWWWRNSRISGCTRTRITAAGRGMCPISDLVGPDLSDSGTNWLPEIITDPVVVAKLAHFGLHSYADNGGGAWNVSDFIENSPYRDKTFWMTEFNVWCDVCEYGNQRTNGWEYFLGTGSYLLNYLDYGASAGLVWEAYDSFYPHHNAWSFWGLFAVDDTNAVPLTYTPQKNFYTLAQISRFIRPGARMIGTSDDGADMNVRSFYHDVLGQLTFAGINTDSEGRDVEVSLQSLPEIANLDLYYTSASTDLCYGATVVGGLHL